MLGLAMAGVQLAPLPASTAVLLSPASHAAYAQGVLPGPAHHVDPEFTPPEGPAIRSPVSVDRSATLRWLAAATACLAVFWAASHYADSLKHLYLVWGSVLAGFFLNTAARPDPVPRSIGADRRDRRPGTWTVVGSQFQRPSRGTQ
ncbi:MAG: hypothetical protein U0794_17915 [Isosphaeraceae bacterium]